ncbi:SMP-30/gluconolactonase/LRE family protein [Actinoallomurus rhizosphaericola]|uniref:SMP-30/gluconolactonase/LRE family protein n=1 Tax=Actinoallomurus rhizosphaericola TaxID=2952536 RepID=UPI0020930CCA|nr:SMP-30/gluconolactonase/LRE family protein [Actinoallomurus rhizosphaericola]
MNTRDLQIHATGLTWGEGPRRHTGALWVSDTQASRLWTDAGGTWTATELDAPANGLWFLPDGTLVAAMMTEPRLGVWNGAGFDTHADLTALAPGALGDLVGDRAGNLYVDDVGYAPHKGEAPRPGRVLRVGADRTVRIAAEGLRFPNGLALIDDETTLIVAETAAQRLTAFDVGPTGVLSGRRTYADLAALVGPAARPDGIWPVPDGIWVATTSGHAVVKVRDGELLDSIGTGDGYPIACCADGRLLYVTVADAHGQDLMRALAAKTVETAVATAPLHVTPPRNAP